MRSKRLSLGKNIEALLGDKTDIVVKPLSELEGVFREIIISNIVPGKYQPRKIMAPEALQELADSIKSQGVIQPVVVREIGDSQYELIAGERRWRAAKMAGLTKIPALVRDVDDNTVLAMGIIENIQRENLNCIEEAHALKRLIEEFSLTHQQVAEAVGKSRTTVTNLLRLIELDETVIIHLQNGDIEMGHGRALLALNNTQQQLALKQIIEKDLTVRETERLAQSFHAQTLEKTIPRVSADVLGVQQNLQQKFGKQFLIQHHKNNQGKLILKYKSIAELKKLAEIILND